MELLTVSVPPAAPADALRHDVVLVVDEVEVVAGAAGHLVGAGAALQAVGAVVAGQGVVQGAAGKAVVAGIADDGVGKRVAGPVDVERDALVRQREVLDVGTEREVDAALHEVDTAAAGGRFVDHVAGAVDHVGVIAEAAPQQVVALAAVDGVVAGVAQQRVGAGRAGDGVVAGEDGGEEGLRVAGVDEGIEPSPPSSRSSRDRRSAVMSVEAMRVIVPPVRLLPS